MTRLLVPFIQLFAFYVIAHGDIGPGGGFQGGVILGAGFILYVITFGMDEGRKRISRTASDLLSTAGVLLFAATGFACIVAGGAYLQYASLPFSSPQLASHLAIFVIEWGIGITVAGVMITLYFLIGREVQ
ncbi:MAG: multicomponent Na+:H+ antiporter subunit B [Nitrospirae bacterium]|nr:MAG: multicomponent Na+:H+ antiporter subunit B [Nitrospirota bacterium]